MDEFITLLILGIAIIVMGVMNTRGNISTLHKHHRKRVSEENRLPFGRLVGLGTIIMGASIFVLGIFNALVFFTEKQIFITIGSIFAGIGFISGLAITIYAMIKYNKGIF